MASDISLAVVDGDSVTTTDSTTPDSVSHLTDSTTAGPVTTTDPLTAIGIQTLSQAVEMLREDVKHERDRADQAERQVEIERQLVEEGRKRIDELQASLADERRRIDGLHTELADARTTAMISGSEAAVRADLRRRGIDQELLRLAEARARERGCHSAWLDTFSFQAPEFYPKFGYREFGRLNYPPDQQRIFFRKRLMPAG